MYSAKILSTNVIESRLKFSIEVGCIFLFRALVGIHGSSLFVVCLSSINMCRRITINQLRITPFDIESSPVGNLSKDTGKSRF